MRQIELIRRSRIPTLALPASRAPANKPSPAHFPSPFPSSFALSPSFLCPSPFSVSYLHETTLHVAGLGGLDGGVDETLTTAHGVEEKLGRRHPRVEAVAHEPLGGRGLGCVCEHATVAHPSVQWSAAHEREEGAAAGKRAAVQLTAKCGRVRFTKPSGMRAPPTTCWPTHAIICEMLILEPLEPHLAMISGVLCLLSSFRQI